MNREQFLGDLMDRLGTLSEAECRKVAEYYDELIADGVESGRSEEEVIASFGQAEGIAGQILAERDSLQSKKEELRSRVENWQSESGERGGLREYRAKGPVEMIVVETRDRRVEVRESSDGQARVWFSPREGDRVSVEEAGGAFRFLHKASFFSGNAWIWNLHGGERKVLLEVPHAFAGTVCVKTTNSRIEAEGLYGREKLQLVSSNGRIAVTGCTVNELKLKTSNAKIEIVEAAGDACDASTSNGKTIVRESRFTRHLWLETSNGAICVENIDVPDISLCTSNGSVKGTVVGREEDYEIYSHTTNAKSNLQTTGLSGLDRRLSVVTSNGGIHIDFTGSPTDVEESARQEPCDPDGEESECTVACSWGENFAGDDEEDGEDGEDEEDDAPFTLADGQVHIGQDGICVGEGENTVRIDSADGTIRIGNGKIIIRNGRIEINPEEE